MEWKVIGHFTAKFDFEWVISVGCKLLCDGGSHDADCTQTKAAAYSQNRGTSAQKEEGFKIVLLS